MKKLLILTIAMFTLLSCSSDDKNEIPTNPIVGVWTIQFNKTKLVPKVAPEESEEDCSDNDRMTVTEDGKLTSVYYNEGKGGCIMGETENGTWEDNGNNNYTLIIDGEDDDVDIVFSNNNNTMVFFNRTYNRVTEEE